MRVSRLSLPCPMPPVAAVDSDEALDDADRQLVQQRRRILSSLPGGTPGFDRHRALRKDHFDRLNRPASTIFLALVGFSK